MPDYEIIEWNEQNFDVNCVPFSAEAYEMGKFAYVSDYARLRLLYEHGGIYLDTDVEMIRPLYGIVARGGFMGIEKNTVLGNWTVPDVALGLGFGVPPRHPVIREIMDVYENSHYRYPDGHVEQITIVRITTDVLKKRGLNEACANAPTTIDGITIYPWDYFCPIGFLSNNMELTANTHLIHHYAATWLTWKQKLKIRIAYFLSLLKNKFAQFR